MKKILIISYYWPPSGGSGVQRWLKFVKYLPSYNIQPVVFVPSNAQYAIIDENLKKDIPEEAIIISNTILEPNNLLSKFGSVKKQSAGFLDQNPSLFGKFALYVRANYFIPDARKYWINSSTKYLTEYIKEHNIDTIISSGPPHSLHIIGRNLQKKLDVKWIADFRDPWTDIDFFEKLPLSTKSRKKHFALEKEVVSNAGAVLVIGETMKKNYLKFNKNIHVVENGFDTEIGSKTTALDKKFSLVHIGLVNSDRNPISLWKTLAILIKEIPNFKDDLEIKLVGKISSETENSIKEFGLNENLTLTGYLNHNEVTAHQNSAQILLLLVNQVPSAKGIITGKIFEYLNAKRPILAIGPEDGDLAEILKNTMAGDIFDFDNLAGLTDHIRGEYIKYKSSGLAVESIDINQYHRKALTGKLVEIIKSM